VLTIYEHVFAKTGVNEMTNSEPANTIRGNIRDIQPNKPSPTLELSFSNQDRSRLPQGARARISLVLNKATWRGTINSVNKNPPYLHTHLTDSSGGKATATQVFIKEGLIENAIVIFALSGDDTLRLIKVESHGQWRPGNEPDVRSARAATKHKKDSNPGGPMDSRQSPQENSTLLNETASSLLERAVRHDFPTVKPSTDSAWSRAPALRVIDCVLSLNRNYDDVVVPRLDNFEGNHADIRSVSDLRSIIKSYSSPHKFMLKCLDLNYEDRARVLDEVVDFATCVAGDGSDSDQLNRLEKWAMSASPEDYKSLRIRGFALAGFQYLRMLFGANTTKPDKHIRRYVSDAVGYTVSDLKALNLLESVSTKTGWMLRDLDTSIWERQAR
jgi:hypothetical protein